MWFIKLYVDCFIKKKHLLLNCKNFYFCCFSNLLQKTNTQKLLRQTKQLVINEINSNNQTNWSTCCESCMKLSPTLSIWVKSWVTLKFRSSNSLRSGSPGCEFSLSVSESNSLARSTTIEWNFTYKVAKSVLLSRILLKVLQASFKASALLSKPNRFSSSNEEIKSGTVDRRALISVPFIWK